MYKLEVTLKQHTPLIHFQHDQEGATLRASEVKPKLDRFIIENTFEDKPENKFDQCKKYLVGYSEKTEKQLREKFARGFRALDYKLRFEIEEQPLIFNNNEVQKDREGNIQTSIRKDGRCIKKLKPYPLFFANLNTDIDDPSEYKRFSFLKKPFRMKIITTHSDLIDIFKRPNILAEFLQYNNFGTRQSKGFGSFYMDEDDELFADIDLEYRYSIDIRNENKKWIDLFESIELFYKSLRSGINICSKEGQSIFYMKSIMFKYAKEKGLQWDKKTIKENYYPTAVEAQKQNHEDEELADTLYFSKNGEEKYLFKDLLGLSSSENWRSPYQKTITKEHVKENRGHNNEVEIERFKSPVIFKPIRVNNDTFNVFFHGFAIPDDFLGKQFKIKQNKQGSLTLKTYPQFDIDEFLDYAIFEVDLKELLGDEDYVNHSKFKAIENMFNQIRKDYE